MLWSDTVGTLSNGFFIPSGYESTSDLSNLNDTELANYENNQFVILSDHNREPISITTERIERKTRMANGTMRSYHISDKLKISVSWKMLPSRSHAGRPDFDQVTGIGQYNQAAPDGKSLFPEDKYTVDGGAGGAELLQWYENHTGPFWVFLSYDKYTNFGNDDAAYDNLNKYNEMLNMYIADFNYSIVKRGQRNFDMWDISVTLEEV
jgi:hypothetical protein